MTQFRSSHSVRKRLRSRSSSRRLTVELLEPRTCLSLSVPAFSSLPDANQTIYLDFNGHVTSGTTWNSGYYGVDPINSPAWSQDSDRDNFSDAELQTIQRIWQRVAEDFSPFNVNVTTVEPPIADLRKGEVAGDGKWGVRAVVTIETTTVRCGCGGIAYIGSFNDLYDEPVFVYNASEDGVAEAISHEVGHSLYLAHDSTKGADLIAGTADDVEYYAGHGSGATGWAPIMGSSYSRSVTTWDKGEFYNAKNIGSNANYGYGVDDLNVITTKNGFTGRADDRGNTNATASPLAVAGTSVSGNGIISNSTDVDMFSFTTGAGLVTLNANPAPLRANLDVLLSLYDSSGILIAESNPATALNASLSLQLAAGTYYLRIDGVGFGTPSSSAPTGYTEYASIGQYTIDGTIVPPVVLPQIFVDDVTISESTGSAAFVVRLIGTIADNASVSFSTANSTAGAGDFTPNSGSVTFVPGGPTTQTVQVSLLNDGASEPSETFNLVLSQVSANAQIADGLGVATITNDDAAIFIDDVSVTEGNVNKKGVVSYSTATFTVSLAHPVDRGVNVGFASAAGTATASIDYQSNSGAFTMPAGQSSGAIPITIIGDNNTEPNEIFFVSINSIDVVIDNSGTGTIIDNDSGSKGGGPRNGLAAANFLGDFTIIDHVDVVEPEEVHLHLHQGAEHYHAQLAMDALSSIDEIGNDEDLNGIDDDTLSALESGWILAGRSNRTEGNNVWHVASDQQMASFPSRTLSQSRSANSLIAVSKFDGRSSASRRHSLAQASCSRTTDVQKNALHDVDKSDDLLDSISAGFNA